MSLFSLFPHSIIFSNSQESQHEMRRGWVPCEDSKLREKPGGERVNIDFSHLFTNFFFLYI